MAVKSLFDKKEIEASIPDRFERIVRQHPDRLAVKSENFSFTYEELNKFANRIARLVLNRNGKMVDTTDSSDPVVLLFSHDAPVIAAIMGVLKSGNTFVALERNHPDERNRRILVDLGTRLILTDADNYEFAVRLSAGNCEVFDVERGGDCVADHNLEIQLKPESIAAIHFTSGSTGKPKGVFRNQQFILHRIWFETNEYEISPEDRISLIHDVSFGASEPDIFGALLNGASLHLFNLRMHGLIPLPSWLIAEKITFFHSPSDLFRLFLDLLTDDDYFPDLRQVTPSGRLYRRDVEKISRHISPGCRIIQRLSSSETGMVTRMIIHPADGLQTNVMPVGFAIPDKEIFIIDEEGNNLGFDQVGEIAVRSRYLVSGYWDEPELTRKTFVPDPFDPAIKTYRMGDIGRMRPDGCLDLIGRKDSRTKIRGYRVELGEIEALLLEFSNIKEAVVLVVDQDDESKMLVAYLVTVDHQEIRASELKRYLVEKLPEYMIPGAFIFLDRIPLNDRNKIDLKALPVPCRKRDQLDEQYQAPSTLIEEGIAQIWSDVLGLSLVGRGDNFFELGGESLKAIQIISAIKSIFWIDISLRQLFENPTIASLAKVVETSSRNTQHNTEIDLETAIGMLGYKNK